MPYSRTDAVYFMDERRGSHGKCSSTEYSL